MSETGSDKEPSGGAAGNALKRVPEERFYFRQFELGPMENFVYLAGDRGAGECVAVDPAWDAESVLREAEEDGMKIAGILLTHTHFDHVNGVDEIMRASQAKLYCHREEAVLFKKYKNRLVAVEDGYRLALGGIEVLFLHTPGHSPGAQCFLAQGRLFTGDTLFVNACGRCDLPGGSPDRLYSSLLRLAALGDDVLVLPGHNYGDVPVSTLGREKAQNPYYRCRSLADFHSIRMG